MTPQSVFSIGYLFAAAIWGIACYGASLAITVSALPLVAKIAIALVVWLSIVLLPLILRGRLDRLDELQQLTFWRNLAAGGMWIVGFMPAMAVFAFLAGGNAIRGLVALAFIAPALMVGFAIGITLLAESMQKNDDDEAVAH
jgi:hypothetical protein